MPEPQNTNTKLKRPSQPPWNGHSYAHAIVKRACAERGMSLAFGQPVHASIPAR